MKIKYPMTAICKYENVWALLTRKSASTMYSRVSSDFSESEIIKTIKVCALSNVHYDSDLLSEKLVKNLEVIFPRKKFIGHKADDEDFKIHVEKLKHILETVNNPNEKELTDEEAQAVEDWLKQSVKDEI